MIFLQLVRICCERLSFLFLLNSWQYKGLLLVMTATGNCQLHTGLALMVCNLRVECSRNVGVVVGEGDKVCVNPCIHTHKPPRKIESAISRLTVWSGMLLHKNRMMSFMTPNVLSEAMLVIQHSTQKHFQELSWHGVAFSRRNSWYLILLWSYCVSITHLISLTVQKWCIRVVVRSDEL